MTAEEFARRLFALTPTEDDLRAEGVPPSLVREFIDAYRCEPIAHHVPHDDDPLVDLIQRYDLSRVKIGVVYLGDLQNWVSSPEHRIVGTVEADGLAIRRADGMVVLLDHDCPSFVMSVVGIDSSRALDALLELAKGSRGVSLKSKFERAAAAARCAAAAGAPESEGFYATLLGAFV